MTTTPVSTMRAWTVHAPGPAAPGRARAAGQLRRVDRPVPEPGPGEVLVAVRACGVCRTDLHLVEGDLPPHRPDCTPGHQVVGEVVQVGPPAEDGRPVGDTGVRPRPGDRVGVAWLAHTCGVCRYCTSGAENLCPDSRYTGWDRDGGYADYVVAEAAYVYPLPADWPDDEVAPLLCAGIIGYRALRRCNLPAGGRLGIYGFGASAHLTAQLAVAEGARVHVVTRSADARRLALDLGAASAGDPADGPPESLDAALLFAPAGELVPTALAALDRGGTLAVAGIHLSTIPPLDYDRHLFEERTLTSVTANTRADGRAFLAAAARLRPRVAVTRYPLAEADRALTDLAVGRVTGAAVLMAGESR